MHAVCTNIGFQRFADEAIRQSRQLVSVMGRKNHPVWVVYDKLRTARLNVKYYCHRLTTLERYNFWIEFILFAAAPGSAIAGIWFFDTDQGKLAWKWLGVVAALAAALKPMLSLTTRIKNMEGIVVGYRTLEYDLLEIKSLIETRKKYDAKLQLEVTRAIARERVLVGKTPEAWINRKIKAICEAEVRRELPDDAFYVPENDHARQNEPNPT